MAIKNNNGPTPVESVKHNDTQVNITTEELRNFVKDDEHKPKTVLYPRDILLDPQLVWKGKDEQDREDLAVPAVPIYIQQKIHPQALAENLRDTAINNFAGFGRWAFIEISDPWDAKTLIRGVLAASQEVQA